MSKIEGYCIQNGEPTLDNPAEIECLELEEKYIVHLTDEQYRNLVDIIRKETKQEFKQRIKELEQENRIQRRQLNSAFDRGWIPKEKVKDKIEEIKLSGGSNGKDNVENLARELVIEVLEELLEEK